MSGKRESKISDIYHHFPIKAPLEKVFQAVSTPEGLDIWWTKRSSGKPVEGADYKLWFGPEYDWRAVVSRCVPDTEFEFEIISAQEDWQGTRVGFHLVEKADITQIQFYHLGWVEANEHYRVSNYCWVMYLRILKRAVKHGERVPYEDRLDA